MKPTRTTLAGTECWKLQCLRCKQTFYNIEIQFVCHVCISIARAKSTAARSKTKRDDMARQRALDYECTLDYWLDTYHSKEKDE